MTFTEDDLFTAVRAFLLAIVPAPAIEVVQGQVNRVPTPPGDSYMVMWATRRARLSTTIDTWDGVSPDPTSGDHQQNTQFDVQLDIHGDRAADLAQAVITLWRNAYACDVLSPYDLAPLYCDDGRQMPFTNDQNQIENRWVLSLVAQANPVVSTAQQFADTVTVGLIEVDTSYPPGA